MSAYRKANIRQLTSEAYQLSAKVMAGVVRQDEESGRWMVGNTPMGEWLAQHAGQDVTCILIPTEDDHPMEAKVCQTCGRDYVGTSCPYCREVRLRLRGH